MRLASSVNAHSFSCLGFLKRESYNGAVISGSSPSVLAYCRQSEIEKLLKQVFLKVGCSAAILITHMMYLTFSCLALSVFGRRT